MWLFIRPMDTLFFGGDGRPFEVGEDMWKRSIFPPYPHTIYGMLRALIALWAIDKPNFSNLLCGVRDTNLKKILGTADRLGTLSVVGPFCAGMNRNYFFPYLTAPADLFCLPRTFSSLGKEEFYLLAPESNKADLCKVSDISIPLSRLGFPEEIHRKAHLLEPYLGFLSRRSLSSYLTCKGLNHIVRESVLEMEQIPVIARDEAGVSREHFLALPHHVRLGFSVGNTVGLAIFIKGIESCKKRLEDYFATPRSAKLGGEGRLVEVIRPQTDPFSYHEKDKETLVSQIKTNGHFRIILATPGYFPKNMYYPDFLKNSLEGLWSFPNGGTLKVRLVSMAIHRGIFVGGRDVQRNAPRRIVKMVPSGSVYYFRLCCNDSERESKVELLVESCFPGVLPGGSQEYDKKGFNSCVIGATCHV